MVAGDKYKNYKNFLNLCYHSTDFGLEAECLFFETSRGKSPCDGIGGTVKQISTKSSLQRTKDEQILTVDKMFQFCTSTFENIKFFKIKKVKMVTVRSFLKKRFASGHTLPGTRSHYHYVPVSKTKIS